MQFLGVLACGISQGNLENLLLKLQYIIYYTDTVRRNLAGHTTLGNAQQVVLQRSVVHRRWRPSPLCIAGWRGIALVGGG